VFYLGSGIGIWGLPKLREISVDKSYDYGLYVAAGILLASALLMAFMPKYRFGVAHTPAPTGSPAAQQA
jgi:hypothetical protein